MYDDDEKIHQCLQHGMRLTAWEADFLEDIEVYLIEHEQLTEAQSEKLDEIWRKIDQLEPPY
jgi:hypothetical protein